MPTLCGAPPGQRPVPKTPHGPLRERQAVDGAGRLAARHAGA